MFRDTLRKFFWRVVAVAESDDSSRPGEAAGSVHVNVFDIDSDRMLGEGDPPLVIEQSMYCYVMTTEGEVWELPLLEGTRLRFSHTRKPEDWDGFHGCSFRKAEE